MNIGSFQGNDDGREIEILKDLDMTQGRFNHCLGRRSAVLLEQILFKRSAVHANSNRNSLGLRCPNNFANPFVRANVAGIESQLVDSSLESHKREFIVKMD